MDNAAEFDPLKSTYDLPPNSDALAYRSTQSFCHRKREMNIAQWIGNIPYSKARGYVYLLALAVPCAGLLSWASNPYPLYRVQEWMGLVLVPVCLVQFFKAHIVGWGVVVLWYAWSVLEQIDRHIEAFHDKGSGDHGSWEGWGMEWVYMAFTAWFLVVAIFVAANYPRKVVHAK